MKKGFIEGANHIFVITCDNLGEYFAEFAKYRKAVSESDDWGKGLSKFYGEGTRAFREDHGNEFFNRKDSRIVEFLYADYDNIFGGRNGRIELELKVDLKSPEWLSQKEKVNQTLKEIWKSGEIKNTYGLDLNWPVASKPEQNQPPVSDQDRIKELEKTNKRLKEQLNKETTHKNIWITISIVTFIVFILSLSFFWFKIKKLKKP